MTIEPDKVQRAEWILGDCCEHCGAERENKHNMIGNRAHVLIYKHEPWCPRLQFTVIVTPRGSTKTGLILDQILR